MQTFRDEKGQIWNLDIKYQQFRDAHDRLGLELASLLKDNFTDLTELLSNPIAFVDLLYLLCEAQCQANAVSQEDFAKRLFGDTYERAQEAFMKALADFYPSQQRETLLAMLVKTKELQVQASGDVKKQIEAMTLKSLTTSGKQD